MNHLEDGKTHINIYSKGKTELGRYLSNFQKCDIETEDGSFKSIEGYWYWLLSQDDNKDCLRNLYGFKAKQKGRELKGLDWCDDEWFKNKIKKAISYKIENMPENIKIQFHENKLPYDHYYVYGGKEVKVKNGRWVIEYISNM